MKFTSSILLASLGLINKTQSATDKFLDKMDDMNSNVYKNSNVFSKHTKRNKNNDKSKMNDESKMDDFSSDKKDEDGNKKNN
jgi:hypothetical protein